MSALLAIIFGSRDVHRLLYLKLLHGKHLGKRILH